MSPWLGITLVLGALLLLLVICQLSLKLLKLDPELSRKMVHIGMGSITACFPFVFTEIWPVLLLAIFAVVSLLLVRMVPALKHNIGGSLHEVKRFSLGEIYFPVAVLAVWSISIEEPLIYSISILVLALADAMAALVGESYGKRKYTTKEGHKSWEGSFAFFSIAFLCIHVPLLLLSDIGRAESLLIALVIAGIVMILEAVSWEGLDNLFIPILVCVLLKIYMNEDAMYMLWRFAILISAFVFVFLIRKRLTLDDSSLMGVAVVMFITFATQGWLWLCAPVTVLLSYTFLSPRNEENSKRVHDIHALISVVAPGLFWLLIAWRMERNDLFLLYNLSYMAELVCIAIARMAYDLKEKSSVYIIIRSALSGFLLIMVPAIFIQEPQFDLSFYSVLTLALAFVASLAFWFLQPEVRDCPRNMSRWLRQSAISFGVSLVPMAFIV